MKIFLSTIAAVAVLFSASLAAGQMGPPPLQAATPPPQILSSIAIDQNLKTQLPLDTPFLDESGKTVKLGDYFGKRPVILSLVYYECPMMCTEVLNGMVSAFGVLKFDIGRDFDVVTISFDAREKPELARQKQAMYVRRYGRAGADRGWHFLTGTQPSIDAVTKAVGFHYQWDQQTQQFAHATAIMLLTPQGKIAQYYYGVEYSPRDLRLGLIEASQGHMGTVVDQVLLYCYHYDPRTGRYGAIISRALQIGGAITIVVLGGFMILMFKLEPKSQKRISAGGSR
ncbi:MAG: SCO family protein [Terriglobales bacterium]